MYRLILPVLAGLLMGPAMASSSSQVTNELESRNSWSYTNCGTATDALQIRSIALSPDPPAVGGDVTIHLSTDVLETIQDGAFVDLTLKLGFINLSTKKLDFCDEVAGTQAGIQCPISKGAYELDLTYNIPASTPRASYNAQLRGYTVDDEELLCLNFVLVL